MESMEIEEGDGRVDMTRCQDGSARRGRRMGTAKWTALCTMTDRPVYGSRALILGARRSIFTKQCSRGNEGRVVSWRRETSESEPKLGRWAMAETSRLDGSIVFSASARVSVSAKLG